jgi:hypothetical protein
MSQDLARSLMDAFAEATGLTGGAAPRRYLWTDAFAVCTYLGLARRTGEERYRHLARALVDQVHQVLGRHRDDDPRTGWISGLAEAEGEKHPTRGGLRIGKPRNERPIGQTQDPRLEWEQDGQYFHYLTKWMHALGRMARETGERRYRQWAAELALVACRKFRQPATGSGPEHLVWKMSIDLSRPLVSSTGQHDALDGLITYLALESDPAVEPADKALLSPVIRDLAEMCGHTQWGTDDPLGIGGLLDGATRLAQLDFRRGHGVGELLSQVLQACLHSLHAFGRSQTLHYPATHRLAFRELGLAIGLHGVRLIATLCKRSDAWGDSVAKLEHYVPVARAIESFWSDPAHRAGQTWKDHADINAVMLATSLAPQGYLGI